MKYKNLDDYNRVNRIPSATEMEYGKDRDDCIDLLFRKFYSSQEKETPAQKKDREILGASIKPILNVPEGYIEEMFNKTIDYLLLQQLSDTTRLNSDGGVFIGFKINEGGLTNEPVAIATKNFFDSPIKHVDEYYAPGKYPNIDTERFGKLPGPGPLDFSDHPVFSHSHKEGDFNANSLRPFSAGGIVRIQPEENDDEKKVGLVYIIGGITGADVLYDAFMHDTKKTISLLKDIAFNREFEKYGVSKSFRAKAREFFDERVEIYTGPSPEDIYTRVKKGGYDSLSIRDNPRLKSALFKLSREFDKETTLNPFIKETMKKWGQVSKDDSKAIFYVRNERIKAIQSDLEKINRIYKTIIIFPDNPNPELIKSLEESVLVKESGERELQMTYEEELEIIKAFIAPYTLDPNNKEQRAAPTQEIFQNQDYQTLIPTGEISFNPSMKLWIIPVEDMKKTKTLSLYYKKGKTETEADVKEKFKKNRPVEVRGNPLNNDEESVLVLSATPVSSAPRIDKEALKNPFEKTNEDKGKNKDEDNTFENIQFIGM